MSKDRLTLRGSSSQTRADIEALVADDMETEFPKETVMTDMDKLAAQLASEVLNLRGPDRLERIKAEAKEVLVAATEQQAKKLATAERRLALLESAVAHVPLDDESERSMSKELSTAQARIAELESELEQGFADHRRIDKTRIAELEQQLSQPPWHLMAERESLKKQVELLRAACVRTKEILDSWGPERWGHTLELLHKRLEAALTATEKPNDQ